MCLHTCTVDLESLIDHVGAVIVNLLRHGALEHLLSQLLYYSLQHRVLPHLFTVWAHVGGMVRVFLVLRRPMKHVPLEMNICIELSGVQARL